MAKDTILERPYFVEARVPVAWGEEPDIKAFRRDCKDLMTNFSLKISKWRFTSTYLGLQKVQSSKGLLRIYSLTVHTHDAQEATLAKLANFSIQDVDVECKKRNMFKDFKAYLR